MLSEYFKGDLHISLFFLVPVSYFFLALFLLCFLFFSLSMSVFLYVCVWVCDSLCISFVCGGCVTLCVGVSLFPISPF